MVQRHMTDVTSRKLQATQTNLCDPLKCDRRTVCQITFQVLPSLSKCEIVPPDIVCDAGLSAAHCSHLQRCMEPLGDGLLEILINQS